jgi:RNA polymerase sigma-70 factor (ECF subfamily)
VELLNFFGKPMSAAAKLSDDLRSLYEAEVDNVVNSLRRLGARSADLEDLTQEVFVRAFQHLSDYDPRRPFRPWLFGITFRVICEARRNNWKLQSVEPKEPEEINQLPDPDVTPERAAELNEGRRVVLRALEGIVPERRAVFVMYELNGHSMSEIAEALGIPLFTAYSRLRVARTQFAKLARRHRSEAAKGGESK